MIETVEGLVDEVAAGMKLLLADDHGVYRDSMALWLQQLSDDIHIVSVNDFSSTQKALEETTFDLAILDLYMPQMQSAVSVAQLCSAYPQLKMVIVTAEEDVQIIERCINAGAQGYVPKSASGKEILTALQQVLAGESYLPERMRNAKPSPLALTDNQLQILALICEGKSNKEIAASLFLAEGTIKQYVTKLLKLLEVDNRVQASAKAAKILGMSSR